MDMIDGCWVGKLRFPEISNKELRFGASRSVAIELKFNKIFPALMFDDLKASKSFCVSKS